MYTEGLYFVWTLLVFILHRELPQPSKHAS